MDYSAPERHITSSFCLKRLVIQDHLAQSDKYELTDSSEL